MLLSIVYCGLNHHTHPKLLWGFPTESYYITLIVFRIDRAGCHRIGKAGDRNERARARKGRDAVENSDPREQYGDENQRDRCEGSAVLVGQKAGIYVFQYLRQNADRPSGYESEQAVFQHR